MCTAVLISWEPALPPPLHPPHLGSYTRALVVSRNRRHLFVTPCLSLRLFSLCVTGVSFAFLSRNGGGGGKGGKLFDSLSSGHSQHVPADHWGVGPGRSPQVLLLLGNKQAISLRRKLTVICLRRRLPVLLPVRAESLLVRQRQHSMRTSGSEN